MSEYLNNRQNEILWKLLADPANTGQLYAYNLHLLVKDFPQSGLLQTLLARSESQHLINHAAAYFNPRVLYSIINAPENLEAVTDGQIIQQLSEAVEYARVTEIDAAQPVEETILHGRETDIEEAPDQQLTEEFTPAAEEATIVEDAIDADSHQEYQQPTEETTVEDTTDNTQQEVKEPFAEEVQETPTEEGAAVIEDQASLEHTHEIINEEVQELPEAEVAPVIEAPASVEDTNGIEEEMHEITTEPIIEEETIAEKASDIHEEVQEIPTQEAEPITEIEEETERSTAEAAPVSAEQTSIDDTVYEEIQEHPIEEVEPIIITAANESFYEDELVTEAGGDEHHKDIDDDIYDEIVGIENISFAQVTKSPGDLVLPAEALSDEHELSAPVDGQPAEINSQKERPLNLDDEADKLIVGNIAATDYFMFDRAVSDRKQTDTTESDSLVSSTDTVNEQAAIGVSTGTEHQEVSKYHDDAMPYTFMWWLDKTRKEHAGTYQPFKLDISQAIRQNGADELQQQYYENIFHINSVEELDKSKPLQTVEFDTKRKEDRIIKKFIVEEPHIGAPSNDKLDTENKARKSAEDQDELVSETLARIYSDQILYNKAINTYKKLMLKFPDKSRYFADLIEQLEKKTN